LADIAHPDLYPTVRPHSHPLSLSKFLQPATVRYQLSFALLPCCLVALLPCSQSYRHLRNAMRYHNTTHSLSTQPCFGHLLNEKLLDLAKLLHVGSRRSETRNASLVKISSTPLEIYECSRSGWLEYPRTSRISPPFTAINVSDKKLARKRDPPKVARAHLHDRLPIKCYGSPVDHCECHRHSGRDGPNSRGIEQHPRCEQ
jgi:hypothetical protein